MVFIKVSIDCVLCQYKISKAKSLDLSVCCRSQQYDKPVPVTVVYAPARRAPPFMSVIKNIRPVRCPFIRFQTVRAVREQDRIDAPEVFGYVCRPMRRFQKSIPVRYFFSAVFIVWNPVTVIFLISVIAFAQYFRNKKEFFGI